MRNLLAGLVLFLPLILPAGLAAQAHTHTAGMTPAAAAVPTAPGQAAFAAVAEIVALLEADSTTDWSRVDLEALRQHLIDMDEVTLRAAVSASPVPGGWSYAVTGTGRTADAIRRVLTAHAPMLDAVGPYQAVAEPITGGIRLVVTARNSDDADTSARIRGLGMIGLLTVGAHHGPHHLALAQGRRDAHSH